MVVKCLVQCILKYSEFFIAEYNLTKMRKTSLVKVRCSIFCLIWTEWRKNWCNFKFQSQTWKLLWNFSPPEWYFQRHTRGGGGVFLSVSHQYRGERERERNNRNTFLLLVKRSNYLYIYIWMNINGFMFRTECDIFQESFPLESSLDFSDIVFNFFFWQKGFSVVFWQEGFSVVFNFFFSDKKDFL